MPWYPLQKWGVGGLRSKRKKNVSQGKDTPYKTGSGKEKQGENQGEGISRGKNQ